MKRTMSQAERVVDYLLTRRHGATGRSIVVECGIMSYTKAVSTARREGYPIEDETRRGVNRMGDKVRYKVYFIRGLKRDLAKYMLTVRTNKGLENLRKRMGR